MLAVRGSGESVPADALSISDESRRAAKAVEKLAERAKDACGDRAAQVAAARARLAAGELDTMSGYRSVARSILG